MPCGCNSPAPIRRRHRGDAELPGKINYLIGNDPAQWHSGVAIFAKVRVEELYPGINLVYYGNQQQLEYDFTIAPGRTRARLPFISTARIKFRSTRRANWF